MKNNNLQYENVFKANWSLYARVYDPENNKSYIKSISQKDAVPAIYVPLSDEDIERDTGFISIPERKPLKKIQYNTFKEYKQGLKMQENSKEIYGNKSQEFSYIKSNFGNPLDNFHEFHTWFWDIEVISFHDDVDKSVSKNDWKPTHHARASMGTVVSIQIYDTKLKEYIILGYKKDWENYKNFKSVYGKINYRRHDTEEELLKDFINIKRTLNPTVLSGWNTSLYDDAYITNRVARILDRRDDLYEYSSEYKSWSYNRDCLNGFWVKELSPVGEVTQREVKNSFGKLADEFSWKGTFLVDYQKLYEKYTYDSHVSMSLGAIGVDEGIRDKLDHSEFANWREFYEKDFNKLMEYGHGDVEILVGLNRKLKLLELAQFIAYVCGVNLDDIKGTVKQWNNYMFINHLKQGEILPLNGRYGKEDSTLLNHAFNMKEYENKENLEPFEFPTKLSKKQKEKYTELLKGEKLGQTFPGGILRSTAKASKWVWSIDYKSLYLRAIEFNNIGIDTLVLPKDLTSEQLDFRAKYAIFYEHGVEKSDLIKFDYEYTRNILSNEKVVDYMNSKLKEWNLIMTPNGMFFRKDIVSVLSSTMNYLISERGIYKADEKKYKKLVKKLKEEIENLDNSNSNSYKTKEILLEELKEAESNRDKSYVYQMGLKILGNSAYGALSMESTVFAGDPELFSGAVTSTARIANLVAGQTNSKLIDKLQKTKAKELKYGFLSYLDNAVQADTDSFYMSVDGLVSMKFGTDRTKHDIKKVSEFIVKYVNNMAIPRTYKVLRDTYAKASNSYAPTKLEETHEIIAEDFISLAPKMYFGRKTWEEGFFYDVPELKITGLSVIRVSTPLYYRKELLNVMEIIAKGEVQKVVEFLEIVKAKTVSESPKELAINKSVNSLNYTWDSSLQKYRQYVPEKNKYNSAPINSRASLVHNKYIKDYNLDVVDIEEGDKISYIHLKMPNILAQEVIAFKDSKVFDYGLKRRIDYDIMYEKGFLNNVKLITDPIGWDLTSKDFTFEDFDEYLEVL